MSARAVPSSSHEPTKEFLQILWTISLPSAMDMQTPVVGQSAAPIEVHPLNLGPQ